MEEFKSQSPILTYLYPLVISGRCIAESYGKEILFVFPPNKEWKYEMTPAEWTDNGITKMRIILSGPSMDRKLYAPLGYYEFLGFRGGLEKHIKTLPKSIKTSQAAMVKLLTMWDIVTHPLMEMEYEQSP